VSKATLDAALAHLESQGIISRRQGAGIFVSSQLKRSIALVCDPQFSIESRLRGFWELIVREARLRVEDSHYNLAFHFSAGGTDSATDGPSLHPALIDDIQTGCVQGVLTVGLPVQDVEWISRQGAAVVAFAGEGPVSVNLDGADVVESGVQVLAKRGCRRIALWCGTGGDTTSGGDRAEARCFRRVLAARGLEFHDHLLRPQADEPSGRAGFDQARDWVSGTFSAPRDDWPDGLLITNDILTRDVMPSLQKFNVLPNRDVIIASHANSDSPVLRAYEDDLSLLEYDSSEIVQTMFDQMEALLSGKPVNQVQIIIKPKVRV
jgi:DNA-binding LacI/PurR family transcriptional regulator